MLANSIPDVQEPLTVEKMDRAELIAHIRHLEGIRSQWEYRIRLCEEKEQLWKNLMRDMGLVLAATFRTCHEAISLQAENAATIAEEMRLIAEKVENL